MSLDERPTSYGMSVLDLALPCLYPTTMIYYKTPNHVIAQMLKDKAKQCLCLSRKHNSAPSSPDDFYKVGVVCKLEYRDKLYYLDGQCRAYVDEIVLDGSSSVWSAKVTELDDVPSLKAIDRGGEEESMVMTCAEAIYQLSCRLQDVIDKAESSGDRRQNKIVKFKDIAELARRDIGDIYELPWDFLLYLNYLSREDKQEILETDKIVDRLQKVIDLLHRELKIFVRVEQLKTDTTFLGDILKPEDNSK